MARRPFRHFEPESCATQLVGLTSEVVRERATGIEPAFSAWEARHNMVRDLRLSAEAQLKAIRTCALLLADTPSLSFCVARNCAESASGTVWHGPALRCKPAPTEDAVGRCRTIGVWLARAMVTRNLRVVIR